MAVGCSYHCRACGSHFSSLEAFDLHRGHQDEAGLRTCWPEYSGDRLTEGLLVAKTEVGICSIGEDEVARGVVIWQSARAAGKSPWASSVEPETPSEPETLPEAA